ncbi:hypothetical protein BCR42DRAFT_414571 [Absidia repens]|uniref:N-acetyltransferase domain-containing protein n=1 Tax=Absidia repens TaxID=90262 RepID=A0A1X2II08_9FUNG|nr:hypothetical protein BCR42DRAFT_414571 [Absidia repens]
MNFKRIVLDLNYCLFTQMGATSLVEDNSLTILNPRNSGHQQSNLACRLRFSRQDQFEAWLNDSVGRFRLLGLQPRYFVDELSTPSLTTLKTWFNSTKDFLFHLECDVDVIMACTFNDFITAEQQQEVNAQLMPKVVKATSDDVEELVQLVGAAFGYGDKLDWLRYKLTNQIQDPQTAVYATVSDSQQERNRHLTSVAILNKPDGLPNVMHVNVCGTHPDHQRKGLAMICLSHALKRELAPGQTAYLEVYDDIRHAQRMYERIGFKTQGTLDHFTATLPNHISDTAC